MMNLARAVFERSRAVLDCDRAGQVLLLLLLLLLLPAALHRAPPSSEPPHPTNSCVSPHEQPPGEAYTFVISSCNGTSCARVCKCGWSRETICIKAGREDGGEQGGEKRRDCGEIGLMHVEEVKRDRESKR
jgi:hypothetical protein